MGCKYLTGSVRSLLLCLHQDTPGLNSCWPISCWRTMLAAVKRQPSFTADLLSLTVRVDSSAHSEMTVEHR